MSQEKVTRYKEQKAHRKEIMKKQKQQKTVRKAIAAVVTVVMFGWIGFSAVNTYQNNKPRQKAEVDYSAMIDYINELSVTE